MYEHLVPPAISTPVEEEARGKRLALVVGMEGKKRNDANI